MDPQTKKQQYKSSKEKRNGYKGLHSQKGVRAIEKAQQATTKATGKGG